MRDTTAFDLEVLIRDLLDDFNEKKKCPLMTDEAEPSGEASTILQAVLDYGGVFVDVDDGLRFRVKVTKVRER